MPELDFLTEPQMSWRDSCNRFMDERITREYVRECDMSRQYYYRGYAELAKEGYLGILIPEEHGGGGGDVMSYAILCEALGKYGVDFSVAASISMFSAMNLVHFGTSDQRQRFLGDFLEGRNRFCIAISEPEAGSDAAAVSTRAELRGDEYIVNGLKQWCSGSSPDDAIICALVRTDASGDKHEGLSVLMIPNDSKGLELNKLETLARRGTGTNQVFLDDVRVPAGNRLGREGEGWSIITAHLELERISIAAAYIGCAQQAVTDALEYARDRRQFGRAIFEFQSLKHMLADMQTAVDAARLLVYRGAKMIDAGIPAAREVSMAKLFASETLQEVSRQGVQILGGAGMLPEADMERYFREGMQSTIGGGTSQIMRSVIAKNL